MKNRTYAVILVDNLTEFTLYIATLYICKTLSTFHLLYVDN